jgi:hypothetical protein
LISLANLAGALLEIVVTRLGSHATSLLANVSLYATLINALRLHAAQGIVGVEVHAVEDVHAAILAAIAPDLVIRSPHCLLARGAGKCRADRRRGAVITGATSKTAAAKLTLRQLQGVRQEN